MTFSVAAFPEDNQIAHDIMRSEIERTEYAGLAAAVGYSPVVIGTIQRVAKGWPPVAAASQGILKWSAAGEAMQFRSLDHANV